MEELPQAKRVVPDTLHGRLCLLLDIGLDTPDDKIVQLVAEALAERDIIAMRLVDFMAREGEVESMRKDALDILHHAEELHRRLR